MPTSLVDADSLLVADVGSITTRTMLFDVVKERYRFLAAGSARTTAAAPFNNISEGIHTALDQLQKITGRTLIGSDQAIIKPSTPEGAGVDAFAATISAGPPLKVLVVGLLEDVSLESARKLASTCYCRLTQTISLNDRSKQETRIDSILLSPPDLVVVAGGTDDGASQSVLRLLESVGLACYLMPQGGRPYVLFAGNQALREEVKSRLGGLTDLHFAPNIRPSLDIEQIEAAQAEIAFIYSKIRARQIQGVEELNRWAVGGLVPASTGLGRVIRFLSKADTSGKGVLGVDLGSSSAVLAAAFNGELTLGVYPDLGLGEGLAEWVDHSDLSEITRWITLEIPDDYIREYLVRKATYPASLPVTAEDLEIEHALARRVMQNAVKAILERISVGAASPGEDLLPWMEPVIAVGSVLTRAPSLAHSALMLLDGLQPTGVTPLMLDQNHLVSCLGAAATVNPLLAVQVLDSNSLVHLGTVISPVGSARYGTTVLRVKTTYENGQESSLDVKQGALEVLPVPRGKSVRLHLQPLHNYDVGMGAPGRGGTLRQVMGGALGIIIDARGRPFSPPADRQRRHELYRKWLWTLGGH
jgi:hypothetical protein